jgi:hypothetical protein
VGATAHLTVADSGEALAPAVVEPTRTAFHVAYRTGTRHAPDRGAAGLAIPAAAGTARPSDWVTSTGALQDGAHGRPVLGAPGGDAAVGVATPTVLDDAAVGPRVVAAAAEVSRALS